MLLVLAAVAQVTVIPQATAPAKDYPIRVVPLTSVTDHRKSGRAHDHGDPVLRVEQQVVG
jgi:hypothetical protein